MPSSGTGIVVFCPATVQPVRSWGWGAVFVVSSRATTLTATLAEATFPAASCTV